MLPPSDKLTVQNNGRSWACLFTGTSQEFSPRTKIKYQNFGQCNQSTRLNSNSAPKNKYETILKLVVKMMSECGHGIPGLE